MLGGPRGRINLPRETPDGEAPEQHRDAGEHRRAAATSNSAATLREPRLGLIRPGYLADLIIVDGNPAENFRHMYAFGAIRMGDDGQVYRTRGIVHTIKDGVVIENANLMREVERMVAESKLEAPVLITELPFRVGPTRAATDGADRP